MKIGIDLSVLQTPHRMRGIGAVVINFMNNLPDTHKAKNEFVFFLRDDPVNNPLKLLDLDKYNFEVRYINESIIDAAKTKKNLAKLILSRKLRLAKSLFHYLIGYKELYFGNNKIKGTDNLDFFIQFDQNQPLPPKHKVKSVLILYDIIPYVMESDYLWSYKTARARGRSRKNAIKCALLRKKYKKHQQLVANKAFKLIAISNHTKNDFVKYIGTPEKHISVCHLGVNDLPKDLPAKVPLQQYYKSSWGYMKKDLNLTSKKFLLFVGGADPRRRIIDLLAAFNNLRAMNIDIKLVLAGDTMLGSDASEYEYVRDYFQNTSYLDDIYFLGFVTEEQKNWLYKHTVAFVYPSLYEGFGLPILEAMRFGAPVITYKNSSIIEVADNVAIYGDGYKGIQKAVISLLDKKTHNHYSKIGLEHAKKFSWKKTSDNIIRYVQ
jgi:glycosyltransferase involved in cell wall biosynthesis